MNGTTFSMTIRPRRQVTLPPGLLTEMGVGEGDRIVVKKENGTFQLGSARQEALSALRALQKIVRESGIKEEEFQQAVEADRIRRYAPKRS